MVSEIPREQASNFVFKYTFFKWPYDLDLELFSDNIILIKCAEGSDLSIDGLFVQIR